MNDWAQDKAREWIDARGGLVVSDDYCIDSLAALLREVALSEWGENATLRAEQTRVAEKLQNYIAMWKEATAEREGIVSLMQHRIEIAEADVTRLRAALREILDLGHEQGTDEIDGQPVDRCYPTCSACRAEAALAPEVKPGSACADRAETVEQTHARWSAQPPEVKP